MVQAQDENGWIIRLGAVGTGTFDDGIWTFNASSGLGQQAFTFQNSWGIALDVHYRYQGRWMTGMHYAWSHTGFQIEISDGNRETSVHRDPTSFTPVLLEQIYQFRKGKVLRPYLGATVGILFTRNIELSNLPVNPNQLSFTFQNPFIYGFVVGVDYEFGNRGLFLQTAIRALTFEYTMEETALTDHQTLLDQVFWMNYNHIQIGIGKRL